MIMKKESSSFPNNKEKNNEELLAFKFLETYFDKINKKYSNYFIDNLRKIKNLENPHTDESIKPKTAQDRQAHIKELEDLKQSNQLLEKKGSIIQYIKKNLLTELTLLAQDKKQIITIPSFLALELYEILKLDFIRNKKIPLGVSKYALCFDRSILATSNDASKTRGHFFAEKNVESEFSESKLIVISLN